jgi:hypothetical protein
VSTLVRPVSSSVTEINASRVFLAGRAAQVDLAAVDPSDQQADSSIRSRIVTAAAGRSRCPAVAQAGE